MKKNGFTVVELIITFVIVMSIAIGLFKIVDSYREKQQNEQGKKEILNYKNQIIKKIENDLFNYSIESITGINVLENNNYCYEEDNKYDQGILIKYKNGDEKSLCTKNKRSEDNKEIKNAEVLYGNEKFVAPNQFITINNDILYEECEQNGSDESKYVFYKIKIILRHDELDDDFSVNIVSKKTKFKKIQSSFEINDNYNTEIFKYESEISFPRINDFNEHFYVFDVDDDLGLVYLLTKHNLNVNKNKQFTDEEVNEAKAQKKLGAFYASSSHAVKFTSSRYWSSNIKNFLLNDLCSITNYSCTYVYKDKDGNVPEDNNIGKYIDKYVEYLKNNNVFVISSDLLTRQRLESVSYRIKGKVKEYPDWLCGAASEPYWLGSLDTASNVNVCYSSNPSIKYAVTYNTTGDYGVRPLITVSKKFLNDYGNLIEKE